VAGTCRYEQKQRAHLPVAQLDRPVDTDLEPMGWRGIGENMDIELDGT
jgi:hypothetical protein